MPRASKVQILRRIEKLSAPNSDPIQLAVALAHLDADRSSPLDVATLMAITGRSRRTLGYLRNIGRRLGELGLAERTFVGLGWTKSLEIARLCTRETLQDALEFAADHTVVELRSYLTGENTGTRAILLRLNNKQYKVFEKALLAHGALRAKPGRGLRHKEVALTRALKSLAV